MGLYKKSQERFEAILRFYKEGKTMTEIEQLTQTHRTTIRRQLIVSGIDVDKESEEKYKEKLEQVVKLYEEGKSQTHIEQTLHLTRKTIRELLKSKGIKYKTKSEQCLIRWGNSDLREDAFETITPESAYWLGMLYTDGSVSGDDRNGYTTELLLQRGDRKHIEKFRDFMRTTAKIEDIKPAGRLASRIRIGSQKVHQSLKNLGFTNQKSYDAAPHESVQNNRDFWRGCVDGDGGVYLPYITKKNEKTPIQLSLCGTLDTICSFIWFCKSNLTLKNKKYPTERKKLGYDNILYSISYYGQEAIQIADFLYKDSTTYLDRKYNAYLEILKSEE
jgi:transposase